MIVTPLKKSRPPKRGVSDALVKPSLGPVDRNPLHRTARYFNHRGLMLRYPMLTDYDLRADQRRTELIPPYEAYVSTVSSRLMGVSLQTATFLRVLCDILKPLRILDLGSGFSSLVFREYAKSTGDAEVVSVDDDPLWLGRTKQFLKANRLSTENLFDWKTFSSDPFGPFDLIFHDLGDMRLRARVLPVVLGSLARHPKSAVVLDDVHKKGYAPTVREELGGWDCKCFDLHRYTNDSYGRYAALVCDVAGAGDHGSEGRVGNAALRLAQTMAVLPGVGPMIIKAREIRKRFHPVDLECGVRIVPDRLHKAWLPVVNNRYHERDTDLFLAQYLRPGDTVFDIGANVGVLTAIAGKRVLPAGSVHSFEVDPGNYRQLTRTIQRNHLDNVQAHRIAMNDRAGPVSFITPEGSWGAFMVGCGKSGDGPIRRRALNAYFGHRPETRRDYHATTIDTHIETHGIERLDLIKIDVDGPELAVLRGGREALRRFRPVLMVEVSMFSLDHGYGFGELFDFLSTQGYMVYASVRSSQRVRLITDPRQAPIDLHREKQAIDLFCRVPGKENHRWQRVWFTGESSLRRAA